MEKLHMPGSASRRAGTTTPPKAVLLVFYRGYW